MRSALVFVLLAALAQGARAEESAPKPAQPEAEKSSSQRVHLGSASVTVVDEHEAIDDVISRIRKAKSIAPDKDKAHEPAGRSDTPATQAQAPAAGKATSRAAADGRAALRGERDRATDRAETDRRKDERRERAASERNRVEQKQHR